MSVGARVVDMQAVGAEDLGTDALGEGWSAAVARPHQSISVERGMSTP
ncbi:MAG: hypothetical protein ACLFTG_16310 [Alphaproteobacteria bacterium]